jgi:bacteriocin biosynthesis cyclodehydratase domain-containing protein
MRPVLRPGSPLLRRDAEHLQLGTEPGHALVLDADGPVSELLCALDGVRTADDPRLDTPLVEALQSAGVVVDADAWRAEAGLEREVAHLLSRGVDADTARRHLSGRRAAEVRIIGDGALASPVAELLEASGVGTISTGGPTPGPNLAILAVDGEAARELGDECLRADVPHLVTAVRDGCGVVGPLVQPGRTACLRCVDAVRTSWDTAWPAILAQLGRPLSASSSAPVRAASAVLDAAVAVLTVRDALAELAGEPVLSHNATIRVGPDLTDLRRHRWSLQPGCGCTLLP